MKIFSAAEVRSSDTLTLTEQGLPPDGLMQRAAQAASAWLTNRYPAGTTYLICCGMGDNGGDGMALAAALVRNDCPVSVFIVRHRDSFSPLASMQRQKLAGMGIAAQTIEPGSFLSGIPAEMVLVDAVLGLGVNRPVTGWLGEFLQSLHAGGNTVVSLDCPSGMDPDHPMPADVAIVQATYTLSFEWYKRAMLHPETGRYAGEITVLPIGSSETFAAVNQSRYNIIDLQLMQTFYRIRAPFSNKGDYGSAMLIAGSKSMIGAAVLCAKSASRSGVGKLFVLAPECGYAILQQSVPEALCRTSGRDAIENMDVPDGIKAVGIGPGIGDNPATLRAFTALLERSKQALVLDADALNLLGMHSELLSHLPAGSILTPHPKEFDRMFGAHADSWSRLEEARNRSIRHNIFIVLKGRYTAVLTPSGMCWYNISGNPGMATGGSGDVLTGLITGLLAQGYTSFEAATMGVFLHGHAGDLAAASLSPDAMNAGDIIDYLGKAFQRIVPTVA